jgi:transcriptional regulator with XRE-family HTH domain
VIATIITTHVNKVMGGSFSAFARQLGVHRRTVWEWGQGTQIPQLETLLQLCAYFEISPIHFLKGHVLAATPAYKQASEEKPSTEQPKRRFRKFEVEKLQYVLEAVLRDQEYPPPSMRETAQRLKYDPSHLYKHFPELCRAIAARHRLYQKEQRRLRLQKVEKEVQQVADALCRQGRFPSERQIGKVLKSRGVLKENAVRIALYNARRQAEEKS